MSYRKEYKHFFPWRCLTLFHQGINGNYVKKGKWNHFHDQAKISLHLFLEGVFKKTSKEESRMLLHHEYLGTEFNLSAPKHSFTTSSCSAEIQTFNVLIHITGSKAKRATLELNFKSVRNLLQSAPSVHAWLLLHSFHYMTKLFLCSSSNAPSAQNRHKFAYNRLRKVLQH